MALASGGNGRKDSGTIPVISDGVGARAYAVDGGSAHTNS